MKKIVGFSTVLAVFLALGAASQQDAEDRVSIANENNLEDSHTTGQDSFSFSWQNPETGRNTTYHVILKELDFHAAEKHCYNKFNGHLAAPSSEVENEHLKIKMFEHGAEVFEEMNIWIGAIQVSSKWHFLNGEKWGYENWGLYQPMDGLGECGSLDRSYFWQWSNWTCDLPQYFICELLESSM